MREGVVKDGSGGNHRSGVMFVVVYYCLSFEGCKHLLGTGAALLSTRKLQVSTGCVRQAVREMSQVLSLTVICFSGRPFLVKPGSPWTAGKCRALWLLELPWSPRSLSPWAPCPVTERSVPSDCWHLTIQVRWQRVSYHISRLLLCNELGLLFIYF